MKFKNALNVNMHIYGPRVVGPYQEFELSEVELRYPGVQKLINIKHIVPKDGEKLVRVSQLGIKVTEEEKPTTKKLKKVEHNLEEFKPLIQNKPVENIGDYAMQQSLDTGIPTEGKARVEIFDPNKHKNTLVGKSKVDEETVATSIFKNKNTEKEAVTQPKPKSPKKSSTNLSKLDFGDDS